MKPLANPQDRFDRKIEKKSDGCIEYIGALSIGGYGVFSVQVRANLWRNIYAHRFAWESANGTIPSGMYIDHLCRNRKCVNVEHLRVVTPQQNATENNTGMAARNKQKTHCKRGHEFTEENTMVLVFPSQSRRQCRMCYEMAQKIRLKSWRLKTELTYGASGMRVV